MNAPETVDKMTRQLVPGDRVWLPFVGGHVRTVRAVEPAGYVGTYGDPVLVVLYETAGLDPAEPFYEGNTTGETGTWQVLRDKGDQR